MKAVFIRDVKDQEASQWTQQKLIFAFFAFCGQGWCNRWNQKISKPAILRTLASLKCKIRKRLNEYTRKNTTDWSRQDAFYLQKSHLGEKVREIVIWRISRFLTKLMTMCTPCAEISNIEPVLMFDLEYHHQINSQFFGMKTQLF